VATETTAPEIILSPLPGLAVKYQEMADPIAFAMGHIIPPLPGLYKQGDSFILTPMG